MRKTNKKKKVNKKTNIKMDAIMSNISIIALNVNYFT